MIERGSEIELDIDTIAFEGKAIGRLDGLVIFVTGAVPGDRVKARITKSKRDYAEAKTIEVVSPSPSRADPPCGYFGTCGGCKWQNLGYSEQLRFKEQHVRDALERTGGLRVEVAPAIAADQIYEYRNKLEFTFSNNPFRIKENDTTQTALGFHVPGRYDKVIDIDRCFLGDEKVNLILNWFRDLISREAGPNPAINIYDSESHTGLLRFLTIRKSFASGEYMVSLVVLQEADAIAAIAGSLKRDLPFVSTFASIVNSTRAQVATGSSWKTHFGRGFIEDGIGDYSFRISPLSFFQTNSLQSYKLYEEVSKQVIAGRNVLYDLYSGTGSISIYLSNQAREVFGFELVQSSVDDAVENARLNGVRNTKFIKTDILDFFKGRDPVDNLVAAGIPLPDLIVLDPPRSGLHPKIAATIHMLKAERIVYVSCNPMTQARDVKEIVSHGYTPLMSQPVDMFPQTYHIENVLTLEKT